MSEYDLIIEALAAGTPEEEVTTLLTEGKFDDELRETQNLYLLLLEQYLDDCSCYSFKGWEDLVIYGRPVIEKFWFEVTMIGTKDLDYEGGINRVLGKNKENRATMNVTTDGKKVIKLRVLRSILDAIEEENQKIARREAENQGYAPKDKPDNQEDEMEDPFGEEGDFV